MAKIEKLKKGTATIYPATIPQAVVDPATEKTVREELDERANHGYESNPKSLKDVDDAKADHGYDAEDTPKTLKEVDTLATQNAEDITQLAGEVSLLDAVQGAKIKDIENVLSSANLNQSAQLSVSGRKVVSLPKNAANGGMSIKLEGLTAENLVVNGDFRNGTNGWVGGGISSNTVVSGVMVNTGNGTNIEPSTYTEIGAKVVGNKYYARAKVRVNSATCNRIRIMSTDSFASISDPVIDNTYTLRGIITASTNSRFLFVYHNYASAAESSGKSIEIEDVSCFNLTQIFGAGNEPDLATCDAMFSDYFEGRKNFVPTGRVRSVDKNGLNPTALYLTAPELRSNGTVKDEVRKGANGYELVKRVGVGTLGSELIINGGFDTGTGWNKTSNWTISDGKATYDGTESTGRITSLVGIPMVSNKWYRVSLDVIGGDIDFGLLSIGSGSLVTSSPAHARAIRGPGSNVFFIKSNGTAGVQLFAVNTSTPNVSIDNFSIKEVSEVDGLSTLTNSFVQLSDGTILYTLATPVIYPISYGGVLNSAENGTVYHEPVIADAGVYGTNLPIFNHDYPIASIEEIIKHEGGVDTYLNASTAVIAPDGLSFTHPDLGSGDLVLFTYAFDKESTNGQLTATFFDSNVVKIDTVTGKAYRINEVVTNGVLTRTLTEV